MNAGVRAYRIGDSKTKFLVSGLIRTQSIVRQYVNKCFRESGVPTAEYAQQLEMTATSLTPSHTFKIGLRIDDNNTTPVVNAIMKQFRSTIPTLGHATIANIDLILQGFTSSPFLNIVPPSMPSLHLFVALWKQSSLSFAPEHVDGDLKDTSVMNRPPLDVADFIITDLGRTRLSNFRGVECAPPRLYSAALWIRLTLPEAVCKLTPLEQSSSPFSITAPLCGRCGQSISGLVQETERHCLHCNGQPRICASCYALRPRASALENYLKEMEACGSEHACAMKMKAYLVDGLALLSCNCDCSSWRQVVDTEP